MNKEICWRVLLISFYSLKNEIASIFGKVIHVYSWMNINIVSFSSDFLQWLVGIVII